MYCVIKCIVRGNQAHVKNADLRHPSCTVVMYRRKTASPVHNVLRLSSSCLCLLPHFPHHFYFSLCLSFNNMFQKAVPMEDVTNPVNLSSFCCMSCPP